MRFDDWRTNAAMRCTTHRYADIDCARDGIACRSDARWRLSGLRITHHPAFTTRVLSVFMYGGHPHFNARITAASAFLVNVFRYRDDLGRRRGLHTGVQADRRMIRTLRRMNVVMRQQSAQPIADIFRRSGRLHRRRLLRWNRRRRRRHGNRFFRSRFLLPVGPSARPGRSDTLRTG